VEDRCPHIFHGEARVDRKSKFVAHCARVTSEHQVRLVKQELLSNKRIAEATHNILAYRIGVKPRVKVEEPSSRTGKEPTAEDVSRSEKKKSSSGDHRTTNDSLQSITNVKESDFEFINEDRDDDGETGAGDKLLFVLRRLKLVNVVVVVTRWFGGVLLGTDRFRMISNTAIELLEATLNAKTAGNVGSQADVKGRKKNAKSSSSQSKNKL